MIFKEFKLIQNESLLYIPYAISVSNLSRKEIMIAFVFHVEVVVR